MLANRENGLYKLQVRPDFKEEHPKSLHGQGTENAHAAHAVSMDTWHKRLGHLSERGMRVLGDGENCMTFGFQEHDTMSGNCVSCLTGKMSAASFPAVGNRRTTQPLEIIHSDVTGPTHVSSWGGARYLLTFTDHCTRMTWGYLMKHKSEMSSHFVAFKTMVEKQKGLPIKIFHSDNGTEFVNTNFSNYLKKHGIVHQLTVPYCSQSNGVAERGFRTLFDKARAMLHEAGLCNRYWGEAVMTAIYLKNRSPTGALSGGIPERLWTGLPIDVSHLRVFGCLAYALIPSQKRRKLDPKAKPYIFIGYGANCKGYRLIDPSNPSTVIHSRTVTFLEDKFIGKLPKCKDICNDDFYTYNFDDCDFNIAQNNVENLSPNETTSKNN
jgi:hypothetical protein